MGIVIALAITYMLIALFKMGEMYGYLSALEYMEFKEVDEEGVIVFDASYILRRTQIISCITYGLIFPMHSFFDLQFTKEMENEGCEENQSQ